MGDLLLRGVEMDKRRETYYAAYAVLRSTLFLVSTPMPQCGVQLCFYKTKIASQLCM